MLAAGLLAMGVLVLSGGCGKGGAGGGGGAAGAGPVPVDVEEVSVEAVVLSSELPGRTVAYRIAEIRPQVGGLIERRLFTEGSDVREGEVLYQIDAAPYEAALATAEASLGRSRAQLPAVEARAARFGEALAERAVSAQDYDDAEAALNQVRADIAYWEAMVETARINLGYTAVKSPIAGRIGRSSVTDGAIVTAYQPVALATVQQLDPIHVDVKQSTSEMMRLRRLVEQERIRGNGGGGAVRLILEDGTEYPVAGELQFRDVSVDPGTATVTLRIVFANPDGVLLPGMFVRAVIEEGVNPAAILVSQQAVMRDPKGEPYVYVVGADNSVQMRVLELERAIGDRWLVASGLQAGDRVIVSGIQKVRPGSVVTVAGVGVAN